MVIPGGGMLFLMSEVLLQVEALLCTARDMAPLPILHAALTSISAGDVDGRRICTLNRRWTAYLYRDM